MKLSDYPDEEDDAEYAAWCARYPQEASFNERFVERADGWFPRPRAPLPLSCRPLPESNESVKTIRAIEKQVAAHYAKEGT